MTKLNPEALRTHILRMLGPKTILCKAFGLFRALGKEPDVRGGGGPHLQAPVGQGGNGA